MYTSAILRTFAFQIKTDTHESSYSLASLGPGDPELITLKGLKTLQKADIICLSCYTRQAWNHISGDADILKATGQLLIHPFILPMSKERTDALNAYNELFLDAQAEYLKGKQIVIVAEGDAGFYSSIQYVYDKLRKQESRSIESQEFGIYSGRCLGRYIS